MNKAKLRKWALERRRDMPSAERAALDEAIFEQLIRRPEVARAKTVMTFVSFRDEVDTHRAIRYWLNGGWRVCVPKVDSAARVISAVSIADFDRDLAVGAYGILEPFDCADRVTPPGQLVVVVVPGLVFDRRGYRIGYGAGYYDRFLKALKPRTVSIGLAFGWQIVERLPTEPWDTPVDVVVTERGEEAS